VPAIFVVWFLDRGSEAVALDIFNANGGGIAAIVGKGLSKDNRVVVAVLKFNGLAVVV